MFLFFVLYHYFTRVRGLPVRMVGLDLKQDVINRCNETARRYGYDGLHFEGAWNEFEVSSDGVLYARPECSAEGDDVLVFKTNIDSIKYLRYCWRDNCRPNLYNSAGLPAGPFYIKVP